MLPALLILLAVFLNFFGRELVAYAQWRLFGVPASQRLIPPNEYYSETLVELTVVFFVLVLIVGCLTAWRPGGRSESAALRDLPSEDQRDFERRVCMAIIMVLACVYLLMFDPSFTTTTRGQGQWSRGVSTAILRVRFLLFGFMAYALASFKLSRGEWAILGVAALVVVLSAISTGGRRAIGYLVLTLLLGLRYQREVKWTTVFGICGVGSLMFAGAMLVRTGLTGEFTQIELYRTLLGAVTGALGTNGILWEVKEFAAESTGYLGGRTFVNYFVYVVVPSPLLHVFTDGEFFRRGAIMFHELYSGASNIGYGFMAVADFYWNFGRFGYLLYCAFMGFVTWAVLKLQDSTSELARTMSIVLVVFVVAGQRSDIGFFVDHVVYSFLAVGAFVAASATIRGVDVENVDALR